MINKGTFRMIPRRKGVGSGYDFFPLFTSSQRTMDEGWGATSAKMQDERHSKVNSNRFSEESGHFKINQMPLK